jgi:hypothetical protein
MSEYNNGNDLEEQRARTFNPNEHVIQLKSKSGSADYLPVQWRLVWFREACPHGTIETEEIEVDLDREMEEEGYAWNNETRRSEKVMKRAKGYARFRAIVTDGKGGKATGTKSEKAVSFPDFIEKAETGAIGRALAALGYGTQFAPELNEEHRIVDAPVERSSYTSSYEGNGSNNMRKPLASVRPTAMNSNGSGNAEGEEKSSTTNALATEQQLTSIRKLCQHLGKPEPEEPENLSYLSAKELISQLSLEYRQSRKAS